MTAEATALSGPRFPVARLRGPLILLLVILASYAVIAFGAGEQAPAQFINAVTIGALYALIALGYTMVYGIIELINFAHGEIFMCGSFVSWSVITTMGITGAITDIPRLVIVLVVVFLISMLVMGVVGVIIERFAYRRLRNAPRLAPLITAIGVSFILQNIISVGISNSVVTIPQLIPNTKLDFGVFSISVINVFVIALALALMVALHLFITQTRLGTAMRSTAMDREAAQLMGVNINTTIAITFFIGSALAGAAGVVQGLYIGVTVFNIGFNYGLKAFTAAVLGGIGNTTGAVLGGFVIGFLEVISQVYGYANWSEAVVFGALVAVLIFRPTGILGQQLADRA